VTNKSEMMEMERGKPHERETQIMVGEPNKRKFELLMGLEKSGR